MRKKQTRNAARRKRDYWLLRNNPTRWAKQLTYLKEWRRRHRDKINATGKEWRARNCDVAWVNSLRRNFGWSAVQYQELLASQNGKCAICQGEQTATRKNGTPIKFHIDHDHTTKVVRGLLCNKCNMGLGYFRDSPDILAAAIGYLCR